MKLFAIDYSWLSKTGSLTSSAARKLGARHRFEVA